MAILALTVTPALDSPLSRRGLAVLLPSPLGLFYLKLLFSAACLSGVMFLVDALARGSSTCQRLCAIVGVGIAAVAAAGLWIYGPSETVIVESTDLQRLAMLESAASFHEALSRMFVAVAAVSLLISVTGSFRRRSMRVRLFVVDLPILVSSIGLLYLTSSFPDSGGNGFIQAVTYRLESADLNTLRGFPLELTLRKAFVTVVKEGFILGTAFGCLATQIILTKLGVYFFAAFARDLDG
jgi:hypothetical protein